MSNQFSSYRNAAGNILIVPRAQHPIGFSVAINRVQRIDAVQSDAELGATLRAAQQYCDISLFDMKAAMPAIAASGESQADFFKNWHFVSVDLADAVTLTPTSRGPGGRYWHLVDEAIVIPGDDADADVGKAMRAAFERCREGDIKLQG